MSRKPASKPASPAPESGASHGPGLSPADLAALGRHDHQLRSLLELSRDLTISLDLFDTTDLLLFNLMGQVAASRSALWLTSERDAVLAVVRCHGFNRRLVDGAMAACQKQLLGRIVDAASPCRAWTSIEDLRGDEFGLLQQAKVALLAPLRSHDELIGWIALGTRVNGDPYGPAEMDVLETALGMIAMALENTRLFNRVRETNRGLLAANEHLTEIDRLKSEFLNNVNHELRTPLAVVLGAVECALEGPPLEPTVRRLLETAHSSSRNLGAIIENLLLWSECAHDRMVLEFEDGDIVSVLQTVYLSRLPGITDDLRELQIETAPGIPPVRFDRHRLVRILDELLDNAVKFTPRGTRLLMRGMFDRDPSPEFVRIEVEDNGPGIPADRLPSLFHSFEQADGSMTRRVGGLGLGLAFAHSVAARMGGSLEVTSHVGHGTKFTLVLPVAVRASATPAPHRAETPRKAA